MDLITTDLNVGNFHSIYKISNSIEDGTVHWFYVYEIHTGGFWYSLDILHTIQKMEKKRGKKEKISWEMKTRSWIDVIEWNKREIIFGIT